MGRQQAHRYRFDCNANGGAGLTERGPSQHWSEALGFVGGVTRGARLHCRFAPPLIHCIPDSRTYSVPLFLKPRCDRTLGDAARGRRRRRDVGRGLRDELRCARPQLERERVNFSLLLLNVKYEKDLPAAPSPCCLRPPRGGRLGGSAAARAPPGASPLNIFYYCERCERLLRNLIQP
jgi:hypothetical protein